METFWTINIPVREACVGSRVPLVTSFREFILQNWSIFPLLLLPCQHPGSPPSTLLINKLQNKININHYILWLLVQNKGIPVERNDYSRPVSNPFLLLKFASHPSVLSLLLCLTIIVLSSSWLGLDTVDLTDQWEDLAGIIDQSEAARQPPRPALISGSSGQLPRG